MADVVQVMACPAAPRPALGRITDRRTFAELRRQGRRRRQDSLSVTWLPHPGLAHPSVRAGFAIGKSAGGAVVRNRIRRRLRAALRTLLADGRLAPGTYLVGGSADLATLPWQELLTLVAEASTEVTGSNVTRTATGAETPP